MTGSASPQGRGAPPQLDRLPDPRTRREWASLFLSSALDRGRSPDVTDLNCFCFFIGYARSGHTLVSTLLNAHHEVVIAHELDAVRYVRHGFRRSQLFSLLLQRDGQFGAIGRNWSGYQYEVPGQSQGRYDRLRVIGDKRARASVLQLAQRPALLDRLRKVVAVPIRAIHVTRNPFDNIATEARRQNMSLSQATEWYDQICQAMVVVRPLLDPAELIDLQYEAFAQDTGSSLAELCQFLGVDASEPYLEACAAIVWPSLNRSRDKVTWSAGERLAVERLIGSYDFLTAYSSSE